MEMPEGWKRVRETNKNLAEYNMESIDEALLLMKEMAEAMNQVTDHFGQGVTMSVNNIDYQFSPIIPIIKALKKFKEWK